MLVQDFRDATGALGNDSSTTLWLSNHDKRQDPATTHAVFNDKPVIDGNINTKVHVLKPGSTTVTRMYKSGKRFDQRGTHALTAAGSPEEWKGTNGQAPVLRTALDDQCKCSLLFYLPKAFCDIEEYP